ncbi:MAG: SRPBCC family protein [Candidatus Eisenbacteria bacterium]|nr:SRPBCC family protein [Candidatus Eisenbacteria bacterium]
MRVLNVHRRVLAASPADVGRLLESLATTDDLLWPSDSWPRLKLDRGLEPGSRGGHGPIRYEVIAHEVGRKVEFRFTAPAGFHGTHALEVLPQTTGGSELVHTIAMDARGPALITWPLVFRPLHDALLEDLLDRAAALTGTVGEWAEWPIEVRVLRLLLGGRR